MHTLTRFRLWLLGATVALGALAACQTNDTVEFIPLGMGSPDAQASAEGGNAGDPADATVQNGDDSSASSADAGDGSLDASAVAFDGPVTADGAPAWTCVAGPGGPGWPVATVCPATEGPVTCVTEQTEDGGDAGVQCRPQNTLACPPPCGEGGCGILPDPDAAIACEAPCGPGDDARACLGWTPCADHAEGACFVWFVADGGAGGWWQGTFQNPNGVWVY